MITKETSRMGIQVSNQWNCAKKYVTTLRIVATSITTKRTRTVMFMTSLKVFVASL